MSDIKYGLDKRVDFIHAIVCSYVIKKNYKNIDLRTAKISITGNFASSSL